MIDRDNVHPTAWIHPKSEVHGVTIGANTRVWQFASVIRKSVVGDDCNIASCAIVDGALVGHRCIVSHGAFIDPGIVIGDDVFIGPHVSLCNDYWPRVSKDGWFDIQKLIDREIIVTSIEDGASIGANAVVMPGVKIGARAMVAAAAVVRISVPADFLYQRDGSLAPITGEPNRMRVCS